ncbi:MAG: asparagine synthase C-terminal domain-containing protein, partial [Saprospiraceae bacterium]|nr:asparagine synthase C-terminal domain-containing protein [Saprospiraceae bacterium]
GHFAFASEVRALLSAGFIPARLNLDGVCNFLMYQSCAAPMTVLEGIQQLMPGTFARYRGGKLEKTGYWKLEAPGPVLEAARPEAVRSEIRRLLSASVERRMVSDVPLGAFLSGGIDSSAVVGLMAQCSAQPVNTFSVTFREPEFDESEYSSAIARRFNTRHTPIPLGASDFLSSFEDALAAMDNPSGDGINTYLVSRATKAAGITVSLSGIGGDELFAGYDNFKRWTRLHRQSFWHLPAGLRRGSGQVLHMAARSARMERLAELVAAPGPGIEHIYPSLRQVLSYHRAKSLLCLSGSPSDPVRQQLCSRKTQLADLPLLSQYTAAELLGYTSNVLLKDTDQMSMASALEVREPFFDHELIEYMLRVPDEIKYPAYPKQLLVESLAPLLPDSIVHRPKKGFTFPWKHWLRHELKGWCQGNLERL